MFRPLLGERQVAFSEKETSFVDTETGTTWNKLGNDPTDHLAGEQMEAVAHGNYFGFCWGVFISETVVVTGAAS